MDQVRAPYETTINQSSKTDVSEEFFSSGKGVANNSLAITHFPPELHVNLAKFLDSKSIMALRQSNSVFSRNIGTGVVLNQIKVECELLKKSLEQRFLRAAYVDESDNPVGDGIVLLDKFSLPGDRKELKVILSEILSDEQLTKWLREKYPTFHRSVQRHENIYGHLPSKDNWDKYLTNQTFSKPNQTWIESLTLDVIFSYHH